MMILKNRYHAVVFHPGPRTRWRTFRDASVEPKSVPILRSEFHPDPAEVIIERSFRSEIVARAWCKTYLRRLKNVCAEIHDTSHIDS